MGNSIAELISLKRAAGIRDDEEPLAPLLRIWEWLHDRGAGYRPPGERE